MGIKHFFTWFRNKFSNHIYQLEYQSNFAKLSSQYNNIKEIDTLLVDMNGIFHTSAQKIFKYGEYSEQKLQQKKQGYHNNNSTFKSFLKPQQEEKQQPNTVPNIVSNTVIT